MTMSWQYIAGFFDGEGHVRSSMGDRKNSTNIRVIIVQSQERGKHLLEVIQTFLSNDGIKSSVRPKLPSPKQLGRLPIFVLEISSRQHAIRFLQKVMPFIHIKKVEAQDVLRYCTLFPIMPQKLRQLLARDRGWKLKLTHADVEQIIARKIAGERSGLIAKDFSIDRHTVSRIYQRAQALDRWHENGTIFSV